MGRKIRAAKASLVAAFLAAGGAAAAKSATPAPTQINWGDQLVRFMKLDGFPAYLKIDGFAALTQFYKDRLLSDAAALYMKYPDDVANALALYQKADAGPLEGILVGLEQYNKAQDAQPLLDYLKDKANLDNYIKYDKWYTDLQAVARSDGEKGSALDFYVKITGIASVPSPEQLSSGGDLTLDG